MNAPSLKVRMLVLLLSVLALVCAEAPWFLILCAAAGMVLFDVALLKEDE